MTIRGSCRNFQPDSPRITSRNRQWSARQHQAGITPEIHQDTLTRCPPPTQAQEATPLLCTLTHGNDAVTPLRSLDTTQTLPTPGQATPSRRKSDIARTGNRLMVGNTRPSDDQVSCLTPSSDPADHTSLAQRLGICAMGQAHSQAESVRDDSRQEDTTWTPRGMKTPPGHHSVPPSSLPSSRCGKVTLGARRASPSEQRPGPQDGASRRPWRPRSDGPGRPSAPSAMPS